MTGQIIWGSLVLGLCSIVHIMMMIGLVKILRRFHHQHHIEQSIFRMAWILIFVFAAIVFAHTIQVWIWAFFFIQLNALNNYSDAVYFALVTYTTVGYGDVTLSNEFRIFAAMASVTGLLGFGISTAILVEVLSKALTQGRNQ